MTPEQINPPAMIQAAFDEARALAECRELIARRDEAKGEFKDAILLLGQKFIEARRMMPDVPSRSDGGGARTYSPAFRAFIEKCGLAHITACHYMSFARDPKKLEAHKKRKADITAKAGGSGAYQNGRSRRRALVEVLDMLKKAADLDAAIEAIQEELNESV